jgi:flagellar assembly protein FliH
VPERFAFDLQLDDGAGPIVGGAPRRSRPARSKVTIRFDYPPLGAPGAPERPAAPTVTPQPPPPPTFSEAELRAAVEAARQEAAAAAAASVRSEMLASLERRQADALSGLSERLAASQDKLEHMIAARAGASRELALALARTLAGGALARQPLADVETMLRELVVRLEGMPWLELRLAPDLLEAGQAALARAAEEADYAGELRVIADPKLGPGEARLSWQDGAAERGLVSLEAEVIALVEAWLPADATAPLDAGEAEPAQAAAALGVRAPPAGRPPEPRPADRNQTVSDGFE